MTLIVTNAELLETNLVGLYCFDKQGGSVGANDHCTWKLYDQANSVAPLHFSIFYQENAFILEDLSGVTFINNLLLSVGMGNYARLNENDVLYIGCYQIRVYLSDLYLSESFVISSKLSDKSLISDEVSIVHELLEVKKKLKPVVLDPLVLLGNNFGTRGKAGEELEALLFEKENDPLVSIIFNGTEINKNQPAYQGNSAFNIDSAISLSPILSVSN